MCHEIQQQVIALLVEQGYSPGQLTPATRFAEDLQLDWLRQLRLVERLEQYFGIDIAGSERQKLWTLRDACASVEHHLLGNQAPFAQLLSLLSLR